ncbi:hypothetical protein [Asticcacaulis solisilvae]|uniref:hypothetical protein n=1 Tax=Asticcacaulis solisilvae TaxID=1217274 RepID=UPI003FD85FF2
MKFGDEILSHLAALMAGIMVGCTIMALWGQIKPLKAEVKEAHAQTAQVTASASSASSAEAGLQHNQDAGRRAANEAHHAIDTAPTPAGANCDYSSVIGAWRDGVDSLREPADADGPAVHTADRPAGVQN